MAAIAHVNVRLRGFPCFDSEQPAHLRELLVEGEAVVWIVRQAEGPEPPAASAGRRYAHFVAKLVLLADFAFGDADDFEFMHAVDFVLVLGLLRGDAFGGG